MNGKEINLTGDNVRIKSDNFNVDKDGNMACNNAKFNGGEIELKSDATSYKNASFRINSSDGSESYMSSNSICFAADSSAGIPAQIDIHVDNDYQYISISDFDLSNFTQIFSSKIATPQILINDEGTVMYGKSEGHKYRCHWTGSQLQFWVDETNVGTLSDKRLKTEIQDIGEEFIEAVKQVEIKQFKIANRNDLISFGILAQDLIEILKKYNKNPFNYEIVQGTQYRTDDNTVYFAINYEQYLILKTKAQDKQIQSLIKRIEKLEGGNNE